MYPLVVVRLGSSHRQGPRLYVCAAREPETAAATSVTCDFVVRFSATISLPISGPGLSRFFQESQDNLRKVTLRNMVLNEQEIRALATTEFRPGMKVSLEQCELLYDNGCNHAFLECLQRDRGPTQLVLCRIDCHVLVTALEGSSRVTRLRLAPDDRATGDAENALNCRSLAENKGLPQQDTRFSPFCRLPYHNHSMEYKKEPMTTREMTASNNRVGADSISTRTTSGDDHFGISESSSSSSIGRNDPWPFLFRPRSESEDTTTEEDPRNRRNSKKRKKIKQQQDALGDGEGLRDDCLLVLQHWQQLDQEKDGVPSCIDLAVAHAVQQTRDDDSDHEDQDEAFLWLAGSRPTEVMLPLVFRGKQDPNEDPQDKSKNSAAVSNSATARDDSSSAQQDSLQHQVGKDSGACYALSLQAELDREAFASLQDEHEVIVLDHAEEGILDDHTLALKLQADFDREFDREVSLQVASLQVASLQATSLQATSLQATSLQATSLQATSLQATSLQGGQEAFVEEGILDDNALALKLQADYDREGSLQGTTSSLQAEISMLSTSTGKAWKFVEQVLCVHGLLIKATTNAVAVDDMVFMAEKMLAAQERFQKSNKPTHVDIGYHYTREENMEQIKTDGLMTRSDREANNICVQSNGESLGDGVYLGNNPFAFHNFAQGDVGILVARLKGQTGSRTDEDGVDTAVRCHGTFSEAVVPSSSCQCVALVSFSSSLIDPWNRTPGSDLIHKYHCQLQEIVDEIFNGGATTEVPKVHPADSSLDRNRLVLNPHRMRGAFAPGAIAPPPSVRNGMHVPPTNNRRRSRWWLCWRSRRWFRRRSRGACRWRSRWWFSRRSNLKL
jgi:hypothetical protein